MIGKRIVKNNKLLFSLFGVINALPFIFEDFSIISWFSFVPFFVFLIKLYGKNVTNKNIFVCIFFFSFSYYFTIYHFFLALYPLTFVGIGEILSLLLLFLAWFLLSLFHALELTVGCFLSLKLSNNNTLKIVSLSFVFVLVEYLQYVGPFSFPWMRVSLPQYNLLPLIQSSSIFGPYFVDVILMLSNAIISVIFFSKQKVKLILLYFFLFLSNLLFGVISMNEETTPSSTADVSLVQGNVLTSDKWFAESSYSTYFNMTSSLENKNDIIVWSETAIPLELNESKTLSYELVSLAKNNDAEMIVGAFYRDYYGNNLNGAYLISGDGISKGVYFKRRLVPFGEYLPFRDFFNSVPFLSDINLYSSDLNAGKSSEIFTTKKGKVGCLICFDSIFHTLARKSVNDGAELIVIITNDSWYKDFPAVYQHNANAIWRAVENNRWVVRCANSGVSSIINEKGETLCSLPPLTKGTLSEKVCFIRKPSIYSIVGDIIIAVPILYFLILFCLTKKCFCKSKSINE